jgi:uncharacterized protein (TIGR00369 family)
MNELRGFASHLGDLLGFTLLEWREGFARVRCAIHAHHLNRADIVHGGVLMSLLDEAGAAAGVYAAERAARRHSVTVSLNCQFTGRAANGVMIATGEVVSAGRNIYFSRSEVRHEESGELLAFGASTHRWRRTPT